jgi:UDP-N-acetylglucosamine/UDP-N-acetylgalactosamine diphosphorylase
MATSSSSIEARYASCRAALTDRGQQHVLRWWDELGIAERDHLLSEIESIPWEIVDPLIASHVVRKPEETIPTDLSPPEVYRQRPRPGREKLYEQAAQAGRELIRSGGVAAFTVAGGQGTRLGFDGPKGAVTVTPAREKTLFQLFAEMIRAARGRYEVQIPWYIMTNPLNHEQTVGFLKDHDFFGLPEEDVGLFPQEMLPAFDLSGRILLADKHRLALAPDGHGGSLKALVKSGALDDLHSRGVEIISYFQIDNPLVRPFDPLFIGLHAETGSEMSAKVTPKAGDLERVGNVCVYEGDVMVVEYTGFPDHLAHARNEDGSRKFDAGNLAIHLLDPAFVDRIIAERFQLPYRRAEKSVTYVDEAGCLRTPGEANAIKLETFVFDALPLARKPLVLEVDRAEEVSPVKNLEGADSLESSKRDQVARACRWLEAAGADVPRKCDGEPDVTVAISPLFALDAEDVRAKRDRLPVLRPGDAIYLEE